MGERTFVAREQELTRLSDMLGKAMSGETQVCFIVGEAGSGKTSLVHEFEHRAEDLDPAPVIAVGNCNAQTGNGDPYLPFRQVLSELTGDVESKTAEKAEESKNAKRLKELLRVSGATLMQFGPDLIGTFVPGASIVGKIANYAADQIGITDKLKRHEHADQTSAPTASTELDRAKIFEQYTNVIRNLSKAQPLVLVLDDLQWADAPSIDLLFHLSRELKDSPVLIIGTYRPDDVALGRSDDRHPLEQVLNETKRYRGDVQINLDTSGEREGRRFIDALLDAEPNALGTSFRESLYSVTGGHPLFTVELLANLQERGDLVRDAEGRWVEGPSLDWDTLPARVEGVIEERIGRLEGDLHEILNVGSVEGVAFTTQVVAKLQDVQERNLLKSLSRELDKRHHLVEEANEVKVGRLVLTRYRFTNRVFQQYIYNELSGGERRLLHGEVAEALEELYTGNTDLIAVQLARHYEQAGDVEKAAFFMDKAGQRAARVSAFGEAKYFFEKALEFAEEAQDTALQVALNRRLGMVHLGLSEFDAANTRLERSLALARTQNDRAGIAGAVGGLGRVATEKGDYKEAKARLLESTDMSREVGDTSQLVPVLKNLGMVTVWLGQYEEAKGYLEESLQLARTAGDKPGMASALNHLGHIAMDQGNYEEAHTRLEEGLQLAREIGDRGSVTVALFNLGMVVARQSKYEEATAYEQEALGLARQVGNKWLVSGILGQLGLLAGQISASHRASENHEAQAYLSEAVGTAMEIGATPVALFALFGVAKLQAQEGHTREALEFLGLILEHPANISGTRELAEQLLSALKAQVPPEEVSAALEHGRTLQLEDVARLVISGQPLPALN